MQKSLLNSLLLLAISSIFATTVAAQVLEEITVTAQKREQSLQDVGISVTAFSGDQMRDLGFTSAIDIVAQTPGLQVSGAGGGAINTFSIRGVTQNDFSPAQEAPVATYVDENYISQNFATNFSLFDIERVEVLRGPQGTLFGRNATGGLVSYITARPSEETEGFAELQLGEQGRRRLEAAIGGAFSDTVMGRLSAVYNKSDGLIENDIGPDIRAADDYSVRAQLLFEPTDELGILVKAQYADEDSTRGGYAHTVGFNGGASTDPAATDFFGYRDADGDPYTGSFDFPAASRAEITDLQLRIERDFTNFSFISLTSFQSLEHGYDEDSDVSPNSVYNYQAQDDVDQLSQEFRVSWETERTQNILGVYYLDIDGKYATGQSGDIFFGPGFVYTLGADQDTQTLALFGQTEIGVTDRATIILGGRLNRDEKDYTYSELGAPVFVGSFSDDDYSARAQLNFDVTGDVLWYVGYNRGIKSGGFNTPLAPYTDSSFYEYGGEVLNAYETGIKASIGESTRVNASVFYYDYEDYQAFTFDGNFVPTLFNAGAESTGLEVELVANPVDGLEILLGASFIDAEVTELPAAVSPSGKADPVIAPEWTLNGLVRYSWPAFAGSMAIQADFNYTDDHNFNLQFTPIIREDAYTVANASINYKTDDDTWYGSIFVRNLTDEEYRSYAFDTTAFFAANEDVIGVERWFGITVGRRWY